VELALQRRRPKEADDGGDVIDALYLCLLCEGPHTFTAELEDTEEIVLLKSVPIDVYVVYRYLPVIYLHSVVLLYEVEAPVYNPESGKAEEVVLDEPVLRQGLHVATRLSPGRYHVALTPVAREDVLKVLEEDGSACMPPNVPLLLI
jgi:hypothetical protein